MLKGHPKGLYVLFFSNMGERFGFYTMLSILVLYLRENFGWDEQTSGLVYGTFLFAIYFVPLFGGWLADKVLGYGRTIILGCVVMAGGYALLGVPTTNELLVFCALGIIAVGNGLFKGNLAVILGNLYEKKDVTHLRDAAFNIYYMGINIGAFFSPHAANWAKRCVQEHLGGTLAQGYNAAFALAGLSILVSLAIFLSMRRYYVHADYRSGDKKAPVEEATPLSKKEEKDRIVALLIVFGIVVFFWMAFHQNGFTLTLFAKNYTVSEVGRFTYLFFDLPAFLAVIAFVGGFIMAFTASLSRSLRAGVLALAAAGAVVAAYKYGTYSDRNIIGPELFQSFNPLFIVFLTPVVVGFWGRLAKRGKEPSSPAKIGLGMLVTAIGFGIMVIGSRGLSSVATLAPVGGVSPVLVSPYWLISTYFTLTIAELFLSPMGLSFVSKVSPPRFRGLMQGGWLGATSVGTLLAGLIGKFYKEWELWQFFSLLVVAALISAILVALVLRKLEAATGTR